MVPIYTQLRAKTLECLLKLSWGCSHNGSYTDIAKNSDDKSPVKVGFQFLILLKSSFTAALSKTCVSGITGMCSA